MCITTIMIPVFKTFFAGTAISKITGPIATYLNVNYSTKTEATFEVKPYKMYKLDAGPCTTVTVTSKDALEMYESMLTIRRIETVGNAMYKEKLIRGFLHLCSGQEAVPVGMRKEIRDEDNVVGGYRIHGWAYMLGISALGILSELTWRKSGCTRGKGGSMHIYSKKFFGGNGIVGAQIPLGAGVALAHKLRNDGGVCWTLYGDGSANQGQCSEAFNMSKLWNLPCIFICEQNNYAMGTRADRGAANTDFYTRGDLVPGLWADGMDVLATREAARFAREHCKDNRGPIILELETYRYFGHSMSDPGISYRTREEVQNWRKSRDPINNFKEKILSAELVTAEQLKEIYEKVRQEVDVAVQQSKTDPFIELSELGADVYKLCLEPDQNVRGVLPNTPVKHVNIAA